MTLGQYTRYAERLQGHRNGGYAYRAFIGQTEEAAFKSLELLDGGPKC